MVLQNGVAERHNPGRIATEVVYSEAVSIKRELQKPVSEAQQQQQLDSYYIEFPSLCESYAPPRKDSAEPLLPLQSKKPDVAPLPRLPNGSSEMPLPQQHARVAAVAESPSKNAESAPSRRRQPQPTGRGFVQSRATAESQPNQRKLQPLAFHRQKPAHGSLVVTATVAAKAGATAAAAAAASQRPPLPKRSDAAVASESTLPAASGKASPLLRLASKPWKDLADCGTAYGSKPSTAAPLPSRAGVARRPGYDCARSHECCSAGRQALAAHPVIAAVEPREAAVADGTESPAAAAAGDCCRWPLPDAPPLGKDAAPLCDSGDMVGRRPSASARCNCHLSWYKGDGGCPLTVDVGDYAVDDDDDDCSAAVTSGNGRCSDTELCSYRCAVPWPAGSEALEHVASTTAAMPDCGSGFLSAAGGVWSATSRLTGYFVHPDSSESLATALLTGCAACAADDPPPPPDDWQHNARGGAGCGHARYHFELFLEAEHGGGCRRAAGALATGGDDHCFDWNCYEDQPVVARGGCSSSSGDVGRGERSHVCTPAAEAAEACAPVSEQQLYDCHRPRDGRDAPSWPPAPAGRCRRCCRLCGCDLDAGPLRLASAVDTAAGLRQLLLPHLGQPPSVCRPQVGGGSSGGGAGCELARKAACGGSGTAGGGAAA